VIIGRGVGSTVSMRRPPRTRLFAASVAVIATLGLAACGDDDDSASTTDATVAATDTDATPTTVATEDTDLGAGDTVETIDPTGDSTPTTAGGEVGSQDEYVEAAKDEIGSEFDDQDIADCVGEAMVNDDVYAAIEEAGVTVEQFSADGPTGLAVDEAVAEQVAADFAACGDLVPQVVADEDELACAADLTNDEMAEFLAYNLLGQEPSADVTAAFDDVETCITAASTTPTT
jgi:hypothetical protein